jgi:catechol 2,3-dioxygenase-like lactoylglutathione lyase family enzyme
MLSALAHVAVCVPDVDAAVAWYESALGLRLLAGPQRLDGDAITADMGELIPAPVAVKAAILGLDDGDNVIELIEYPEVPEGPAESPRSFTDPGISHIGLVCDDIDATRRDLEAKGVVFLTTGAADVARLRTAWFRDPWGAVFILMEKSRPDRAYWRQYGD